MIMMIMIIITRPPLGEASNQVVGFFSKSVALSLPVSLLPIGVDISLMMRTMMMTMMMMVISNLMIMIMILMKCPGSAWIFWDQSGCENLLKLIFR